MADSNLNIQQKVKFTLETELDKQSKIQVGKQLRDILSDAVVTFDKDESAKNLKPVVDMINKVFEKADMQIIDEGSVEASFKKIAEMSADTFQAAFEAAIKNNGGIRLSFTDFKLDDIVTALGKIESKIKNVTSGAARAVQEDIKDINGAIERLGKNAASYKSIKNVLKYQGESSATYKSQGKSAIQGLYRDYDSAATWEDKQQALIKYVKAYEGYIEYLTDNGKTKEAASWQASIYGDAFKEMQQQFSAAKQGLEDILVVKNKNDTVAKAKSALKFDGSNKTKKDDFTRLQELSDNYTDSILNNDPWEAQHQSLLRFVRAYDKYISNMSTDAKTVFESQNSSLSQLYNLVSPNAKTAEIELRAFVDDADYRNTYELSEDRNKPWAREKTLQEVRNILKGGLKVSADSGHSNVSNEKPLPVDVPKKEPEVQEQPVDQNIQTAAVNNAASKIVEQIANTGVGKKYEVYRAVESVDDGNAAKRKAIDDFGAEYWSTSLETAASYAADHMRQSHILQADVFSKNPLVINANGFMWNDWESIPGLKELFPGIRELLVNPKMIDNDIQKYINDQARMAGFDTVVFENVQDVKYADKDEEAPVTDTVAILDDSVVKLRGSINEIDDVTQILQTQYGKSLIKDIKRYKKLDLMEDRSDDEDEEYGALLERLTENLDASGMAEQMNYFAKLSDGDISAKKMAEFLITHRTNKIFGSEPTDAIPDFYSTPQDKTAEEYLATLRQQEKDSQEWYQQTITRLETKPENASLVQQLKKDQEMSAQNLRQLIAFYENQVASPEEQTGSDAATREPSSDKVSTHNKKTATPQQNVEQSTVAIDAESLKSAIGGITDGLATEDTLGQIKGLMEPSQGQPAETLVDNNTSDQKDTNDGQTVSIDKESLKSVLGEVVYTVKIDGEDDDKQNDLNSVIESATSDLAKDQTINDAKDAIVSAISGGAAATEPKVDKETQRQIKQETGNQNQRFERLTDIASNYEDVDDVEAAIKQFGEVYKQIVLMSDDGYKYIKPNKSGINTLGKIVSGDFDVSDYSGVEFQRVDKPSTVTTNITIDATEITNAIKESAADTNDLAKEETLNASKEYLQTIADNTKIDGTAYVVSPAEANQIAQEQTLQQILGALNGPEASGEDNAPEPEIQAEDDGQKMRTAIMQELAKYGTFEDAMKAGGKRIQFDGSEVHFGSFVSDYLDKFLGQSFNRSIYEDIWKEARKQFYQFEPVQLTKEDAIDIIREKVPENVLDGWFRKGDSAYKTKLESIAMSDDEIRNAALNIMWSNFNEYSGKDIGFNEFLNSEIPVYRGKNSENYVNGDELLAFSFDESMAKKFGNHLLETLIKPIDTLGAFQTTAEAETLVYRKQLEDRAEYKKWHADMDGVNATTKLESVYNNLSDAVKKLVDQLFMSYHQESSFNERTSGSIMENFNKNHVTDEQKGYILNTLNEYKRVVKEISAMPIVETEDDEQKLIALQEEAARLGNTLRQLYLNDANANGYARNYGLPLSDARELRTICEYDGDGYGAYWKEMLRQTNDKKRSGLYDEINKLKSAGDISASAWFDAVASNDSSQWNDLSQKIVSRIQAETAARRENVEAVRVQMQSQQQLNTVIAQEPDTTDVPAMTTSTALIPANVDESAETKDMTTLLSAVQAVTEAVKLKTRAFWTEKTAVDQVVAGEVAALDELENKLTNIKKTLEGLLNNIGAGGSDLAAGLSNINVTVNTPENSKVDFEDGAIERLISAVNGVKPPQDTPKTTDVGNVLATENTLLAIKTAVEAINGKTVKGTKVGGSGGGHKKTTKSDYTGSPFFSEKLKTREMELAKFAQQLMNTGRDTDKMKAAIKKLQDSLKLVNSGASLSVWDQLFKQTKLADNIDKLKDGPETKEKIESYKQLIDFANKYYRLVEKYEKAKDGSERKNTLGKQKSDAEAFLAAEGIDFETLTIDDEKYNRQLSDARTKHKNNMAEIEAANFDKELAQEEAAAEKKKTEELKKQEKIVAHINDLHKQLGELQALYDNSSDDMRGYYEEKIRDLEAQIALEKKQDTSLVPVGQKAPVYDKTQKDAKSAVEDKILLSMMKAEDTKKQASTRNLIKTYEELAKQRAIYEQTGDLSAEHEANRLRGIISSEQQRLGITHEQIDALRRREEIVFEEQKAALDAKQREQNRQSLIKEEEKSQKAALRKKAQQSRSEARVGQAKTAINRADDLIFDASAIEGIDASEIVEVQQLNQELVRLRDMYNAIQASGGPVDQADQEALVNQTRNVKAHAAEVQRMLRQYEELSGENVTDTGFKLQSGSGSLYQQLEMAAKAATNGKGRIKEFDNATGQLTVTTKGANNTFTEYTFSVRELDGAIVQAAGSTRKAEGFFDGIIRKSKEILTYFSGSSVIYRAFAELKRGVQYVREIDSALTELKKVTNETEASYDKFLKTASKTADKVGSTIQEIVSSTADWSRLGYSMEEAAGLAESTSVLLNVSEFQSIDEATSALVSTMQAFSYTADQSMYVVDVMNEIGNSFAVSSDGIATALQDSASALMTANNSYEEAVSLVAAANRVVQNPSEVGGALRTIALRLRGTSVSELEEMGEDTVGVVGTKSKMRSKLKGLTGVDILTDTGAYKSTYEILLEISKVWKDLTDEKRAGALELIAGKNRANVASALLTNTKDLEAAYKSALDAEGSAYEENQKYLDSIQGRIDQFNNAVQTMWSNTLDDEWIKGVVELGTGLIKIVDTLGLIPSILALIGASKGAMFLLKGLDVSKLISDIAGLTMGKRVFSAAVREETLALASQNMQMSLSSSTLVKYAIDTGLATAAQVGQMTTTQLLALSFKALGASVLGAAKAVISFLFTNPVGWLILATGAVVGLVAAIDAATPSTEELREELDELKNSLTDLDSELNSVNSELETTQKRIAELLSMPSLSFEEKEELSRLQKTNAELERRQALLTAEKKRTKEREAEKAAETVDSYLNDRAENGNDYYKTQNQLEGYIDGYQAMIDQRKKLEEQLASASREPNRFLGFLWETDSDAEKIQAKLDTLNESISETEQYIDTTLGDLEDSLDGVEYGYGADKQLDYVNNLRHQWEVVYGSDGAKTNAIAEIFNRKAYSEAYDSITELAQKLQEDPDDKTIIEKIRDQIKIAEDDILASGATIEDALSYFTSLSVEHNSDTLDGITNQYAKGVEVFRRFKDAVDDARTISYSDVNGDTQDITWDELFTKDDENNFKAQADEIAKVLKGCDENTRDAFARLAEGVQNGQYDFNAAIESFTASGLVEASKLIESQLSEMNSEMFKGVELSGIIDTFEEFRSVLDDVANSMDLLHTAQTQMNNAGRISVKTALDIIDSTDNWNECLKIENGAITLNSEASKVLIQDKLDLAKANLQQALTTVEAQIAEIEATESSSNLAYTMEESTNMAVRSLAGNMAYLTKMMEAYTRIANGETGVNLQDYIDAAQAAQAQVEGDLNYTKNAAEKIGTAELEKKKSELEAQIKMLEGIDTVDEFKDNYDFDKEPGDKYDDDDDDDESALDKIKKKYEHKLAMLDAQKTYLENEISRLEAENKPVSKSLYEEQIKIEEKKLKLYEQERAEILATMNTVEKGSDEWNEMAEEVWGLNHAIQESTLSVVELNDAITQLYIDAFDKIGGAHDDKLTFFDDQKQYIEDYINYLETLGVDVPDEMYEKLISVEEKSLEQSYEKLADLENQLAEAEKNGLEETDEEWVRMNADIREVESSILASKTAIEEWNNAIREAEWGKFDEIMNRVNDVKTETDNVAGLFDTDDVANEDGTWTKEGITQLGLHYQQMMSAQAAAEEYAKAIEELNEEYETTDLSESEYYERLQELKDGQWDAINSTEEYKEAIVDLHEARVDEIENGIEQEIEAYEELIKVKKDELDAERDLHDFRNNVKDQTKDIAALERKIASMSGSTDAATVAERTRLEAELREKQDSLNDTYYDHAMDSQSSALDDELESFEKNKNDYLEQLRQTLEQTKFLVESTMYDVLINADVVLDGIQGKADEYGITLSPKLTDPWTAASAQAQQFKTDVGESLAALTNDDGIISAYNQTANSLIAAVFASGQTQAGGYVTSVREVLDAVYQPGGSIYTFSVESGKLVSAPFEGGDTLATNFNDAVNNVLLLMYGAGGSIDNFSTNSDNLIHAPFANGSGYASEFSNNVLTELSGIYGTNGSAWLFNEQVKSAFEGAFGAGNMAADGFKGHVANQIDLIRQDIYSENPQLTSYLEQPFKTASSYAKNTFKTDIENTLTNLVKTAKAKADEIDSYATDIVNDMNRAQAAIDNTGGKSSGGDREITNGPLHEQPPTIKGYRVVASWSDGNKTVMAQGSAKSKADAEKDALNRLGTEYYKYVSAKFPNAREGVHEKAWADILKQKKYSITSAPYYAKGTTGTTKDQWAITDEPQYGDELVLVPGKNGNLSYMRKGTAVIPADISENLMKLGMNPDFADMEGAVKNINLMTNYVNKPEIKLDIENFLHVDNVSQDTMPELKKFVKEQVNTMVRQLNYGLKRN